MQLLTQKICICLFSQFYSIQHVQSGIYNETYRLHQNVAPPLLPNFSFSFVQHLHERPQHAGSLPFLHTSAHTTMLEYHRKQMQGVFGSKLKGQFILLFNLFLLLFMDPTILFSTIHVSHYTILTNFYFYLQNFQQKVFSFSKISGSQIDTNTKYWKEKCEKFQGHK